MFVHARQVAILEKLRRQPRMAVEDLRRSLKVSRSTLRRDLLDLEERGELLRVHGGVLHPDHVRGEPSVEARRGRGVAAKRAMAAAAARLVESGSTVFVDAGTSCLELGRLLSLRDDVRIYTNSLPLLTECGGNAARMNCIGGEFRHAGQATVGALAWAWLDRLRFDVAFLGASGLDERGVSTTEFMEASVKQAACVAAERAVLLADHGKLGQPAAVRFADWSTFSHWVVDSGLSQAAMSPFKAMGVDIVRAVAEG